MLMGIDINIFRFFNDTCQNDVWNFLMPFVTEFGGGTFLFAVALVMLFFKNRRTKVGGILLMAGLTFSYQIVHVLKTLVARPRPFLLLPDVNTMFTTGGFSFPSTHSAMIFMAVFVMTGCCRGWYILYLVAAIVAVSRVYLGLHFPSDVICGAFIGMVVGYALIHIAKNTKMLDE